MFGKQSSAPFAHYIFITTETTAFYTYQHIRRKNNAFLFLPYAGREERWLTDRAVGYSVKGAGFESQSGPCKFLIAPLCPPSTKWLARSLQTRRK
ncbi:hypothetical protein PoB_005771700 [Plakobranchus ocellatus]|uniref:Uncharacterized protein n=1 Tax=Plakobranchus ocellatus TaxID=259542 RepID=A0AAV4CHW6_9GAST|nr:hypothetical protein PoB_005771700 [Plakobranchus ocellatus]